MPQDQPHGVQRPGSGSICPYGKAYYFHCLAVLNDNKMQTEFSQFYYYFKLSIVNKLYYCRYSAYTKGQGVSTASSMASHLGPANMMFVPLV